MITTYNNQWWAIQRILHSNWHILQSDKRLFPIVANGPKLIADMNRIFETDWLKVTSLDPRKNRFIMDRLKALKYSDYPELVGTYVVEISVRNCSIRNLDRFIPWAVWHPKESMRNYSSLDFIKRGDHSNCHYAEHKAYLEDRTP